MLEVMIVWTSPNIYIRPLCNKNKNSDATAYAYISMNECRDRNSLGVGAKVLGILLPGAKVPRSESSRERKFHTMVLSLPGAKVLRSESSIIPVGDRQ